MIATSPDEPIYASSDLLMFESRATTAPLCCMAEQPLSGKVLVVVGGTTGLGLSAARAFLSAGARGVVVTGRDAGSASAATASLGGSSAAYVGNATDPAHAPGAIALARERFGGFHALYQDRKSVV